MFSSITLLLQRYWIFNSFVAIFCPRIKTNLKYFSAGLNESGPDLIILLYARHGPFPEERE